VARVYDAPGEQDGRRVLVDRLWPRGLTKERAALDEWLRDVAPTPALRTWYAHEVQRWPEFQQRYRTELETGAQAAALDHLRGLAAEAVGVTLLTAVKEVEISSAAILAQLLTGP
jgi:uncharacterized protein YeaO (DUF488 family)